MGSKLRKEDIIAKINELGIYLENDVKWTNDKMIKKLGDYYLGDDKSFARNFIQSMETVQLCHHLKDEISFFSTSPLESDDFVAEYKLNGCRCITVYSPEEGFRFFSRNETVTNFLNNEFTDKLVFIQNGVITKGSDYKGKFPCRFVLDGELLVDDETMTFEGRHYENMEDFLQGILSSLPQRAIDYQTSGHPIRLCCYDIMYFEPNPSTECPEYKFHYTDRKLGKEEVDWVLANFSPYLDACGIKKKYDKTTTLLFNYLYSLKDTSKYDVRKMPFYKRRQARKKVLDVLAKAKLPFSEVDGEDNFKIDYLDNVLRSGGEGILVKCLDAPYIAALKSSRSHKACMKVKQTVSEMMKNDGRHTDFDVFISGCNPPKSDRIKDMIGALKCSIYLENDFGEMVEHEIANISGIPHEWKRKLAVVDENGKISLNPEYLGKVIAIDGMALSHTSLRFQHAVLKEKDGLVFKDKAPKDCEWTKEALEKMVIVRGFE